MRYPDYFPNINSLAKALETGSVSQSILEAARDEARLEADNVAETGNEDAYLALEDLSELIQHWLGSAF